MLVTASQIATYLYCPRKLFLEYVLGLEVPESEALVLGKLTHKTHELMNHEEEKLVKSLEKIDSYDALLVKYRKIQANILETLLPRYRTKLRGFELDLPAAFEWIWPRIIWEAEERAQNLFQFHQKHKLFGEPLWEHLTPKIEAERSLSSQELRLKGVVDQVKVFPDKLIPIELKTGRAPAEGIWPSHRVQVGVYLALLRKQNPTVKEGFVKYLDANALRPIIWTPFLEQEVFSLRDQVIDLLSSKALPDFVENKNKCSSCAFKEQCYDEAFMKQKVESLRSKMSLLEEDQVKDF